MSTQEQLQEALRHAISIIESYEMDIRARPDLVEQGFCQGTVYRDAVRRVRELAGQRVTEIGGEFFEER